MSNRDHFIARLKSVVDEHEGEGTFYLFSADFAGFKLINYRYGFDQGDELLEDTVAFLQEIPICLHCEWVGADHFIFIIIVRQPLSKQELLAQYDMWKERFLERYRGRYAACELDIWCGIYQLTSANIPMAIDNANMARRKAKTCHISSAVFFEHSLVNEMMEEKQHEKEVMQALEEKRFTFFLQPQVSLDTGEIVGAEALARGMGKDGRVMSPALFIPIMEKNGAIIKLDFLILEQVCAHLRQRLDQDEPVVRISINLSRMHLNRAETMERIQEIVERYDIPPALIMFELTESILLDEMTEAIKLGEALTEMGFHTSIDDFGSGYAGIDIWRNLVFDELKLDRSFLMGEGKLMERNQIIAAGLAWIASQLDVSVICEGVEEAEQCQILLNAGCHLAQGFYFSKPVPADEFYASYDALDGCYPLCFKS